uniref:Ubiquitin-like domain-containing protein n=1 Tax=Acrobeloides nanus TaxID=290746 RepID=A0A914D316_9BILA
MIITIHLVGGESDWLNRVNLDPQISFTELEKLIETMTTIPPLYQYITWRGKLIPASKNPLQSIKEGEELVVFPKQSPWNPHWIALVSHDGINEIYFVKTHYMGSTKSSRKSASVPDLREVFCYILLEKIGLGPECHFYTTPPGMSEMTLYIATKSIPNMEHMENATPSSSNIINIIMEIHLASSILCLADVHARNCGYQNLKPVIFDFSVPPNDEGNYKMKLEDFSHMKPQCVDTIVNAR